MVKNSRISTYEDVAICDWSRHLDLREHAMDFDKKSHIQPQDSNPEVDGEKPSDLDV